MASSNPSYLAEVSVVGGSSKLFLRLHAAFMLTAWIGTASVGILLARYFKQTWVGSQLCGKDQWFAVSLSKNEKKFNLIEKKKNTFSVASYVHDSDMGINNSCICFDLY